MTDSGCASVGVASGAASEGTLIVGATAAAGGTVSEADGKFVVGAPVFVDVGFVEAAGAVAAGVGCGEVEMFGLCCGDCAAPAVLGVGDGVAAGTAAGVTVLVAVRGRVSCGAAVEGG